MFASLRYRWKTKLWDRRQIEITSLDTLLYLVRDFPGVDIDGSWGQSFAPSLVSHKRAYNYWTCWWRSLLDGTLIDALCPHQGGSLRPLFSSLSVARGAADDPVGLHSHAIPLRGLRHQRGCPGKFCQDFLCCWGSSQHQAANQRSQSLQTHGLCCAVECLDHRRPS